MAAKSTSLKGAQMSDLTRRETIGAAVVGLTATGAAMAAGAADASASNGAPTLPHDPVSAKYAITRAKPTVDTKWGTVIEATAQKFPIMQGSAAAAFHFTLEPGALREPHWHPNAWELDVCIAGEIDLGVVNPDGTQQIVRLTPGDIGFIPRGWAHFLQNPGKSVARLTLVFNNDVPNDIGLSTTFGGMPTSTFTQTLGIKADALNHANKPNHTLFFVP
jgi:oxalate decarboxylase